MQPWGVDPAVLIQMAEQQVGGLCTSLRPPASLVSLCSPAQHACEHAAAEAVLLGGRRSTHMTALWTMTTWRVSCTPWALLTSWACQTA